MLYFPVQLRLVRSMCICAHLEAGTIKALAIANDNRDPQLPNTPTLKERGIDMSFALERGVVAPKGTPKKSSICGPA